MLGMVNLVSLLVSSIGFTVFYSLSVRPAHMEITNRKDAYKLAARYRMVCSLCMGVAFINFVLYRWFPVSFISVPVNFPWPYWISLVLAIVLGIPAGLLMVVAIRDAGKETMKPDKEHTLYTGIYDTIRHPQAIAELTVWNVCALVLHSPLLTLVAALYTPIWIMWCFVEEKDLILRYGQSYREYQKRTGMFIPRRRTR